MNKRASLAVAAILIGSALVFSQRLNRRDRQFGARLAELEQKIDGLQQKDHSSELERLKAENSRLLSENDRLRRSTGAESRRTANASLQTTNETAYDPLAFYRRNPE